MSNLGREFKVCARCLEPKSYDDFRPRADSKHGRRDSYCKPCRAAYGTEHHSKERVACQERKTARRRKNRDLLMIHLKSHPCVDCGETDPLVLDFDHVRGKKRADVTKMAHNGVSLVVLLAEIEKCDIRCANDHRRRTAKNVGNWRLAHIQTPISG